MSQRSQKRHVRTRGKGSARRPQEQKKRKLRQPGKRKKILWKGDGAYKNTLGTAMDAMGAPNIVALKKTRGVIPIEKGKRPLSQR